MSPSIGSLTSMYEERRLSEGVPPYSVSLAEHGRSGRLAIYAGAGMSRDEPTALPSGSDVAAAAHHQLNSLFDDMPASNKMDLTSVADAAELLAGGSDAMRAIVVRSAEFIKATPNYGHEVLATLLLEGFLAVLTTNWDNCIERAGNHEQVLAIVTQEDLHLLATKGLLKLHGCATRPATLLISTSQLENPPAWVVTEANARLVDSYIAFVGVGDVAGYMRQSVMQAIEAVGDEHVRVVSRSAKEHWNDSAWSQIIPDLAEDNKIGETSNEFLDAIACAYVLGVLQGIVEAFGDNPLHAPALERIRDAMLQCTALWLLRWFRSSAVAPLQGQSAIATPEAARAVLALGTIQGDLQLVLEPRGHATIGDSRYSVVIAMGLQSESRLRREAQNRLQAARSIAGRAVDSPTFLISAAVPLHAQSDSLGHDVIGLGGEDDVLDGPLNSVPTIVDVMDVLA